MINFKNTKSTVSADNKVSFCGLTYMVTDADAEKLKGILDGMVAMYGGQVKSATKPSFDPEKAKDVTVDMTANGTKVTIPTHQKRDVWTVLERRFKAVGGQYDKTVKVITFKSKAAAEKFAKNNTVTADERRAIWAEWHNK